VAYLVEYPVSAVIDHLEGNVGAILDALDARCGGHHVDTESGSAISFVITDDELVCARRGVEIAEGGRGSRGRDQHANYRKITNDVSQGSREEAERKV
jgi:hypothetical protein